MSAHNAEGEVYRDPAAALRHCNTMIQTLGLSKRHGAAAVITDRRAASFAGRLETIHSGEAEAEGRGSGSGSDKAGAEDKV